LQKVSVAIITKNEEKRLPACLNSVSFADEIVVVDSGSTDKTVEIATAFGCRVFVEDWKGYGPQKNSALKKCSYDWVFILDADERVPVETAKIIQKILISPEADAYCFKRKNYLHGRWLRHSGYWPDKQVRLVNKCKGSFQPIIHEIWVTSGNTHELDAHFDHYGFSGYSDMLETLNDHSTLHARELYIAGRRATPLSPACHGMIMFLKIYFLRLGFLDGFDGLVTAVTKADGSFFKYAKLLELQRDKSR
jgi:glycosyltransferase involved in cell wall biosynthesis